MRKEGCRWEGADRNAVGLYGTHYDWNPEAKSPRSFLYEVGDPEAPKETWRQGTGLIRNLNALLPLPAEWRGAATGTSLTDEQIVPLFAVGERFFPYMSITTIFNSDAPESAIQVYMAANFGPLFETFGWAMHSASMHLRFINAMACQSPAELL